MPNELDAKPSARESLGAILAFVHRLEPVVEKLEHVVYGNGQPGIVGRLARIETGLVDVLEELNPKGAPSLSERVRSLEKSMAEDREERKDTYKTWRTAAIGLGTAFLAFMGGFLWLILTGRASIVIP